MELADGDVAERDDDESLFALLGGHDGHLAVVIATLLRNERDVLVNRASYPETFAALRDAADARVGMPRPAELRPSR